MSAIPSTSDPRWIRLNSAGAKCSCGERHVGLFPIHMTVPAGWTARNYEPDDALRMDGDFLSQNLGVKEGRYFAVRMRLPLPLQGLREHALMFTVWTALDRPDFESYVQSLKSGAMKQDARAPARLINRIATFPDTFGLMGSGYQQTDGGGPYLLVDPVQQDGRNNHVLAIEQRQGVALDRMLDIYAAHKHDMRLGLL